MSGTKTSKKTQSKNPAGEWYAKSVGTFIPHMLPLAEQIMREAPSRIELEQRRNAQCTEFIERLVPAMLPFMEAFASGGHQRTEAEIFRDKWYAQIAYITAPRFLPF